MARNGQAHTPHQRSNNNSELAEVRKTAQVWLYRSEGNDNGNLKEDFGNLLNDQFCKL
jgi:hypothetical protein